MQILVKLRFLDHVCFQEFVGKVSYYINSKLEFDPRLFLFTLFFFSRVFGATNDLLRRLVVIVTLL